MTNVIAPQTPTSPPPAPPGGGGRGALARLDHYRNVLVPTIAVIALVIYFQAQTSSFVSADSAQNILRQMAFLTVVALAGTFVILIGGIDLSVAANATLA